MQTLKSACLPACLLLLLLLLTYFFFLTSLLAIVGGGAVVTLNITLPYLSFHATLSRHPASHPCSMPSSFSVFRMTLFDKNRV